jgi:hypothetical protein
MIAGGMPGLDAADRGAQMREYILIDFENVQPTTVAGLKPGACGILLFLGEKQAKVSIELMQALQPFGASVEVIRISGSGPNAVDFHIAYTIGRLAQAHPDAGFNIVSRDTGFDPLVRYVTKAGIRCRRVASLGGASAKAAPGRKAATKATQVKAAPTKNAPATRAAAKPAKRAKAVQEIVDRVIAEARPTANSKAKTPAMNGREAEVIARLKGLKVARPARLKTLQTSIASWFKLPEGDVAEVVRRLQDGGYLLIDGTKVAYNLK